MKKIALVVVTVLAAAGCRGAEYGGSAQPQAGDKGAGGNMGDVGQVDRENIAGRTGTDTKASSQTAADGEGLLVKKLHAVNQMEIQAGELAQKNAASKEVKQFAATLIKDHRAAEQKLGPEKGGASAASGDPMTTDPDLRASADAMKRLQGVKGAEFDRQFIAQQITSHEKTIAMIEGQRGQVKDQKLSANLDELLTHVKHHRDEAQRIQTQLEKRNTSGNESPQQPPQQQ